MLEEGSNFLKGFELKKRYFNSARKQNSDSNLNVFDSALFNYIYKKILSDFKIRIIGKFQLQ